MKILTEKDIMENPELIKSVKNPSDTLIKIAFRELFNRKQKPLKFIKKIKEETLIELIDEDHEYFIAVKKLTPRLELAILGAGDDDYLYSCWWRDIVPFLIKNKTTSTDTLKRLVNFLNIREITEDNDPKLHSKLIKKAKDHPNWNIAKVILKVMDK